MNVFYQCHKPALKDNENFELLSLSQNSFCFTTLNIELAKKINRYLIEEDKLEYFISDKNFIVYSCIYFGEMANNLNKIQVLYLKKKLIRLGWEKKRSQQDIYIYQGEDLSNKFFELQEDLFFAFLTNLFIVVPSNLDENMLYEVLAEVDFTLQPDGITPYVPTEKAILTLIDSEIGLAYLKPNYQDGHDAMSEREVLVFYSSWYSGED